MLQCEALSLQLPGLGLRVCKSRTLYDALNCRSFAQATCKVVSTFKAQCLEDAGESRGSQLLPDHPPPPVYPHLLGISWILVLGAVKSRPYNTNAPQ